MAQATLAEMAREVRLYSGEVCPIMLCERWVRDRYRKVCERQIWSFKVGRGTFGTPAAISAGSVLLTNGDQTVAGSSTTWTTDLIGRQFKVEGFLFTITDVNVLAQTLELDMPWLGATGGSKPYSILQAYITPAADYADFHSFYSITDPTNAWLLHLAFNVKELDRMDARRSASGIPRVVANGVYNASNQATFELWPNPQDLKQYLFTYEKRMPDLTAADAPPPIIRSDVLVKGALAELARWPGQPERKNPLYDPYFNQWKIRESEFEAEVAKLIVEDQSIMQTDLTFGHGDHLAPLDARFLQNHAY